MKGLPHEWTIGLVTTVLGTFFGVIATRVDGYLEVRQYTDLHGEWLSLSDAGEHDAVRDRIIISTRRGKLYLKNLDKPHGYDYEGHCRIKNSRNLEGQWISTRPGASAKGVFLLQISTQGTSLYGVYSGVHSDGRNLLLGWVLGRDEASLQHGIETLKANTSLMRIPEPKV